MGTRDTIFIIFLESAVKTLEIQDDNTTYSALNSQSYEKADQEVEVHVLQSGQIEFSTPLASTDSSAQCTSTSTDDNHGNISSHYLSSTLTKTDEQDQSLLASITEHVLPDDVEHAQSEKPARKPSPESSKDTQYSSMDVSTQTFLLLPSKEPPLIIRRSHTARQAAKSTFSPTISQSKSEHNHLTNSLECTSKIQRPLRRSSRKLSQGTAINECAVSRRHMQKSGSGSPSPSKKRRKSSLELQHSEPEVADNNPLHWSVEEVSTFIGSVPRCNYIQVFRDHVSQGSLLCRVPIKGVY